MKVGYGFEGDPAAAVHELGRELASAGVLALVLWTWDERGHLPMLISHAAVAHDRKVEWDDFPTKKELRSLRYGYERGGRRRK